MTIQNQSQFNYNLATVADKDRIYKFLEKYFFKDEPCTKALKLSIHDIKPLYESVIERCLQSPFSTIVTTNENEVAGVLLNSIWRRTDSPDEAADFDNDENASENMKIFVQYLNDIHSDFWNLVPSDVNAVLHREISSVGTPFQRRGIASRLAGENMTPEKLKKYGIDGIISETTSHANQMLLAKKGFKCLKELPFTNMKNDRGECILIPADDAKGIRLNFKPIAEFLN